jgi:hypothetical protein
MLPIHATPMDTKTIRSSLTTTDAHTPGHATPAQQTRAPARALIPCITATEQHHSHAGCNMPPTQHKSSSVIHVLHPYNPTHHHQRPSPHTTQSTTTQQQHAPQRQLRHECTPWQTALDQKAEPTQNTNPAAMRLTSLSTAMLCCEMLWPPQELARRAGSPLRAAPC